MLHAYAMRVRIPSPITHARGDRRCEESFVARREDSVFLAVFFAAGIKLLIVNTAPHVDY